MNLQTMLILSALLFAVGLGGALTRRNAILLLASIEVMMNAANLSMVAFWRAGMVDSTALSFAVFTIVIAGAESAVGLALVISIYRHIKTVDVQRIDTLKG